MIDSPAGSGASAATVYVVDDERDLRVSLVTFLRTVGVMARPFASADDFLAELSDLTPGCIITDLLMPEKNGLTLLALMRDLGYSWPVIFLTGHGDVTTAVKAMKLGAAEFLEKPLDHADLLAAIDRGCEALATIAARDAESREAQDRLRALTPRQRSVLQGIMRGESNKKIGAQLNLSSRTVEMHRAALMRSLNVATTREALAFLATAGGNEFLERLSL